MKKHKIETSFPNLDIALRIFLTIAVANSSGERSFSALKRVKNFQRSTVHKDKLNNLSILFIENDVLEQLDSDSILEKFASQKVRKHL